jgi:hypothetical protein
MKKAKNSKEFWGNFEKKTFERIKNYNQKVCRSQNIAVYAFFTIETWVKFTCFSDLLER